MKPQGLRLSSLDILRGFALFGMILSGIEPSGLPLWMYHVQVPPGKGFDPTIPGIGWVDLVFPFFMFSLGAAIPFALTRRMESNESIWKILGHVSWRSILMCFFALYLGHYSPWSYGVDPNLYPWIRWRTLAGFFCLVLLLGRIPWTDGKKWLSGLIKVIGFAGIATLLVTYKRFDEATGLWTSAFSGDNNDIIILILARSYILIALLWMVTRKRLDLRLCLLGVFVALRLHGEAGGPFADIVNQWISSGSWHGRIMGLFPAMAQHPMLANFTLPLKWFFDPGIFRIATICLMGSIVGDVMFKWLKEYKQNPGSLGLDKARLTLLLVLLPMLTIGGLYFFYTRQIVTGFIATSLAFIAIHGLLTATDTPMGKLVKQLCYFGTLFLLLGYILDPVGGGIKKDPATLSYYFAPSGMATTLLAFLFILVDDLKFGKVFSLFRGAGCNAMLGYIAGSHFLFPVLHLVGLIPLVDKLWGNNVSVYFLFTVALTLGAMAVTAGFTRLKLYLRV